MSNDEEILKKELVLKEEQLLENSIRNDAGRVAELMDGNYMEFTESGKRYTYRPGDLLGNVDGVLYIDSNSISLIELSENCKLLLYVAAKVNKNIRIKTNCSSVWKKTDGKWKIVFNQRTNCSE